MQNTLWNNSPLKEPEKKRLKIYSKSKPFKPTYATKNKYYQNSVYNKYEKSHLQANHDNNSSINFNNLLENGCFQLLNEKLAAYATGRFQVPHKNTNYYYNNQNPFWTETKSQSTPSGAQFSDNGYMEYDGTYGNSERSESKNSIRIL